MSYHRLEINLLPPEMQPSPFARFVLLINITIIGIVILAILGHAAFSWFLYKNEVDTKAELTAARASKQQVVDDYAKLTDAKDSIDRFGRIAAMISLEYLDVPLLLDRLALLIPESVYLERISNDGMQSSPGSTTATMTFRAARQDPWLLVNTLTRLKNDPIFHDCYLTSVTTEDTELTDVLRQAGITWKVEGPEMESLSKITEYTFDIRARIKSPLNIEERPLLADFSELVQDFQPLSASGGEAEADEPLESPNAPAGVAVEGVN